MSLPGFDSGGNSSGGSGCSDSICCPAQLDCCNSLGSFSSSSWITGFWLSGAGLSGEEVWEEVSRSKLSAITQGATPVCWESVEDIRLKIPLFVSCGSRILTLWARLTGSLMAPLWMAALAAGPWTRWDVSPLLLSWEMVSRSLRKYKARPSSEDWTEKSRDGCLWWLFICFWAAFWMCFLAACTAFAGLICHTKEIRNHKIELSGGDDLRSVSVFHNAIPFLPCQ